MSVIPSGAIHQVVVNGDGQYAIWPLNKAVPEGWERALVQGSRDACLEFIRKTWIDMRPCSVGASIARAELSARG
jgi:MbtH protein